MKSTPRFLLRILPFLVAAIQDFEKVVEMCGVWFQLLMRIQGLNVPNKTTDQKIRGLKRQCALLPGHATRPKGEMQSFPLQWDAHGEAS